jgi:predicted ATP-binding protein involved in virulence
MKIHALKLQNFRGFEDLHLALDPSLTLLIGENGAGKTAVIDGLAVALRELLHYMDVLPEPSLDPRDARARVYDHAGVLDRQPQWPMTIGAEATIGGQAVKWECFQAGADFATVHTVDHRAAISIELAGRVRAGEARALPVVARYGTERLWSRAEITQVQLGVGSRFDGYEDALDRAPNPQHLARWMFQQTLVELQRRQEVPQLRAVERAVCRCIDRATRFYFDMREQELMLEREGSELLPFSSLSDGYRSMVALVADLARRAVILNPHLGADAAERAEGIALIDEIDLHLHAGWQRRVLRDLRRTFPGLQLVTTTHSPQILASVRREEVRVLVSNTLLGTRPFVEGRDANSLLEDVLAVAERPEDMRARLDEVARLLDDERYEQAAERLDGLEAQLGPDDPAVIRARWILAREAVPKDEAPPVEDG